MIVDKITLIFVIITISLAIGGFAIRELYKGDEIVDFLFGGVNIVYFWYLIAAIANEIWNYIYKKENKNRTYIINNLILYPIILICIFVFTIRYLRTLWSLLVWLPLMVIITTKVIAGGSGSENDQSR